MQEIEVKILDINRSRIEAKLISLGAEKVFDDRIEAEFFDFPDNSIRDAGEVMRLRREGKKVVLAFKAPVENSEAKVRHEYEVELSDYDTMKKILESLGMHQNLVLKKCRVSYKLPDARFEFDKYADEYAHIPEFLEIEAKDIETIHKYADMLGFSKDDCRPWSVKELIGYYKK